MASQGLKRPLAIERLTKIGTHIHTYKTVKKENILQQES